MFKTVFLTSLLLSFTASAHIEEGVYSGTAADGSTCSMTAGENFFENNQPHPVNERIKLTVNGQEFVVRHPVNINSSKATVRFNHDLFQGVIATSTGAAALEVEMVHSDEFEGPRGFVVMSDSWKSNTQTSLRCADLKLQH